MSPSPTSGTSGFPSGTVTFLFTDIEGSTELLRRLGDDYGEVVGIHRRLVRDAVESYHGVEVDTQGDSFFFAFRRASDGVRAAIDAQRALSAGAWPDGATVRVRMGLHTGEATVHDERYHGLSVHRGARIAAVAHGGQVLLSESTRSLLADEEQLRDVGFRDLGPLQLKDFDQPIRVYRLTAPGLENVERRPRAHARSRRRLVVAAAVALAVVVGAAVSVAMSLGGGRSAVRVPADSVAVVDPGSGKAHEAVPVGRDPGAIALDSSAAWVANGGSGTITRIDARTHATSTIGGLPTAPSGLATGADRVWATEQTAGLASVDINTQTASAPVPLLAPSGIAYSADGIAYRGGSLWVGAGLPTGLWILRVDSATEQIGGSVRVGPDSRHSIAVGNGGVWISELLANTVTELDPATLRVVRRISVGGPTAIALGGGSLWVCGADDKAVWRFRSQNGYRSRTLIPVGGDPVAVAYGEGVVWVALANGTLTRIDPASDAARRRRIAPTLNGVAAGGGNVWAVAGSVSFL